MIRTHGVRVPSKLRTFLFDRRRTDRLPIDHLRIDLLRVDCLGKDGPRNRGQTKRPPGNVGGLLLQGRIVPTEAKNPVKTFLGKNMSRKTRVSSNFWEINVFLFNSLRNEAIS